VRVTSVKCETTRGARNARILCVFTRKISRGQTVRLRDAKGILAEKQGRGIRRVPVTTKRLPSGKVRVYVITAVKG
jgi:hypothetical protein